jgi:hypothetical protein
MVRQQAAFHATQPKITGGGFSLTVIGFALVYACLSAHLLFHCTDQASTSSPWFRLILC